MVGTGGIQLDGSTIYTLTSLPDEKVKGRYLTCLMYAGAHHFGTAEVVEMLGLPYEREWLVVGG